jgi:hypothetical protein
MTDFADTITLSTDLDTDAGPSAAGGGEVVEQAEPASVRSDLEAVFKDDAKAPAKEDAPADDKPADENAEKSAKDEPAAEKAEPKPEQKAEEPKPERARAEDGKFAQRQKDEQPKEGRRLVEAPQSFLPQAKDVWRNTPHAVQTEVARLVQEHEAATQQTRETVERYESIRQYDDLARSNGRDLRESLEKMGQVENLLQRNPLAGLNAILMEIGPRKADGQPFSLYEVAQFVAQQEPSSYQQMIAQGQQPETPKEDPRVAQLEQRLAQMAEQQAHAAYVEPFAREHPRFQELELDIAFFLQSGKVPTSLSPMERLAAAYDMAERINPPSYVDDVAAARQDPAEHRRADDDFSGSKSIKSSPGSVSESYEPEAKRGESSRDSLLAELRRMNR